MRTIHVSQAGRHYFIDGIYWGDDEEGVMLYLSAKGVSPTDRAGIGRSGASGGISHPARVRGMDSRKRV